MNEAERIRQLLVQGVADLLSKNSIGKDKLKQVAIGLTTMAISTAIKAKISMEEFQAAVERHWLACAAEDKEKKALN